MQKLELQQLKEAHTTEVATLVASNSEKIAVVKRTYAADIAREDDALQRALKKLREDFSATKLREQSEHEERMSEVRERFLKESEDQVSRLTKEREEKLARAQAIRAIIRVRQARKQRKLLAEAQELSEMLGVSKWAALWMLRNDVEKREAAEVNSSTIKLVSR